MPEDVVTNAASRIVESNPILGSICVILAAGIVFMFYIYRKDIKAERDEHEKTRQEHITDVRRLGDLGEKMREQTKELSGVMENALDFMRGRDRT